MPVSRRMLQATRIDFCSYYCFVLEGDRSHSIPSNEVRGCVGPLVRDNCLKVHGLLSTCGNVHVLSALCPNSPGALDGPMSQLGSGSIAWHSTFQDFLFERPCDAVRSCHLWKHLESLVSCVPTSFNHFLIVVVTLANLSEEPNVPKDVSIGQQCPSSWGQHMAQRVL